MSAVVLDPVWYVNSNPSTGNDVANGVAVDSTGIYVVGYDSIPGNLEWRIQKRSKTTGGVIWSRTSNPTTGSDEATGVAVDTTGIYVVGFDEVLGGSNNYEWRIQKRSLTTGALIWSRTSNPLNGSDIAYGVAVDDTGIYIVGAQAIYGSWEGWRIEKRSKTTGALIWSRASNPSAGSDVATDVAVDSTGIYVVGWDEVPGNREWRIQKRSKTTGGVIWSRTSNPSLYMDAAFGVAVDTTGVYTVGEDTHLPGDPFDDQEWRIQKRSLTTGALIWSRTSNPSTGPDVAMDVAVFGSGVYVVGYDCVRGDLDAEWRIQKRDKTTGALIRSVSSNPSEVWDIANGVAVDSTGVYVAGFYSINYIIGYPAWEDGWRIEKRKWT